MDTSKSNAAYFYPRPPRGGRPLSPARPGTRCNFYPRPPRGGRPDKTTRSLGRQHISIHALREEGDWLPIFVYEVVIIFLSTPSARRATLWRG